MMFQKLEGLPIDVFVILFHQMHPEDLFTLRATNRFFNALVFNFMSEVCFKDHKKEFFFFLNKTLENYPKSTNNSIKTKLLIEAIQNPQLSIMGRINALAVIAQGKKIKLKIPEDLFTLLYEQLNEQQIQKKEAAIGVMAYIIPFLSSKHCEKTLQQLGGLVDDSYPIGSSAINTLKYVVPRIDKALISSLFKHINHKFKGSNYTLIMELGEYLDENQVTQTFNTINTPFINHQQCYINNHDIAVLAAMASQFTEQQATQFRKIILDQSTKTSRYSREEVLRNAVQTLSQALSPSQIELFRSELLDLIHQRTNKDNSLLLCYLVVLIPYLKPEQLKPTLDELNALFNTINSLPNYLNALPNYLMENSSIELFMDIAINEVKNEKNKSAIIPFLLKMTPKAPKQFQDYLKKLAQKELLNPLFPGGFILKEFILSACAFHEIQLETSLVIKLIKEGFGVFERFPHSYRMSLERLFSNLDPMERTKVIEYLQKELQDSTHSRLLRNIINTLTLMIPSLEKKDHYSFLEKALLMGLHPDSDVGESILVFFVASASYFTPDQVPFYLNYGIEKLKDDRSTVQKGALQLISALIPRITDMDSLNSIYKEATLLLKSLALGSQVRQEAVQLLSCLICKNISSLEPMDIQDSEYTLLKIIQNMWRQVKEIQPIPPSVGLGFFDKKSESSPTKNVIAHAPNHRHH